MEHVSDILDEMCMQEIKPIDTGILFLDKMIGGYFPGEMTTLCGEEVDSKKAFVVHQVCHIAIDQKIPTLVLLNYENERKFLSLMITYYYSIRRDGLYDIFSNEEYQNVIADFKVKLKESSLYIVKSGFFEDKSVIEEIDRFVAAKNIKMMFLSEVILDLRRKDDIDTLCSIRTIAIRRNISLVVSVNVWNDREGVEYMRPSLRDLGIGSYVHGHDVVIGFTDYDEYGYWIDGQFVEEELEAAAPHSSLYGKVALEILKPQEDVVKRLCYFPRDFFFLRDYSLKEQQKLKYIERNGGKGAKKLIRKLDLVLDEEWKNPF